MIGNPKITGIWEHLEYSLSDYFRRAERQNPDPDRIAEKITLEEGARICDHLEDSFRNEFPDGDTAA